MKRSRWKDPVSWFFLAVGAAIALGLLAWLLDANRTLSKVLWFSAIGALAIAALSVFASIGINVWLWLRSLRTVQGREEAKLRATVFAIKLGVVAIVFGSILVVSDYRSGSTMVSWPWIGDVIATSRLRDWPKALGEEARDVTVERCERADDQFLCFVKKLDHDGVYRTMPCYFNGAVPNRRLLGMSLEQFCGR